MSSPTHGAHSDESFRELLRVAREAWPQFQLADDELISLLRSHAERPDAPPPSPSVAAASWLALACAKGDPRALRELEASAFPAARAVLGRMGLSADTIAEVLQIVREKLLVAAPGETPGILAASAHGDLPGLIRVAAVRTALNLRRKDHRLDVGNERLLVELCPDDDPELAALKEQHRAAFKTALEDALQSLSAQERNILRMHLLHGLSIDAIGSTYQVHRATAARWLTAIRAKLDQETRRLLRERKGLTDPEVDSLVRLVESRIQVSFQRVLGSVVGG